MQLLTRLGCRWSRGGMPRLHPCTHAEYKYIAPALSYFSSLLTTPSGRQNHIRISGLSLNFLRSLPRPSQSFVRQFPPSRSFRHSFKKHPSRQVISQPHRSHVQALIQIERPRGEDCKVEEDLSGSSEIVETAEVDGRGSPNGGVSVFYRT
jgi:hypothetical protein